MSPFTRYLLIGAIISIAGGLGAWVLRPLVGPADAYRITVALVTLALVTTGFHARRTGLSSACVAWLLGTIALVFSYPSFAFVCGAYALLLTAIRGIAMHKSLWMTAADVLVSCFGLAAAAWSGLHSGSIGLAIWSYVLVTSLLFLTSHRGDHRLSPSQGFDHAMDAANAALHQLSRENTR